MLQERVLWKCDNTENKNRKDSETELLPVFTYPRRENVFFLDDFAVLIARIR